jgi:hypothetical protein
MEHEIRFGCRPNSQSEWFAGLPQRIAHDRRNVTSYQPRLSSRGGD